MTIALTVALVVLIAAIGALWTRLRRAQRRAAELGERVRALERESAGLEHAKQRFLASITHELRTPLTAILGYQELLADGLYGEMNERLRRPIHQIGHAAGHLLRLIDEVLELARLETDHFEVRLGSAPTGALITRAAASVGDAAAERGVRLETDLSTPLPRLTTDADRLERALQLALLAAVHACSSSPLRLAATADASSVLVRISGADLALDARSPDRLFGGFDDAPDTAEPVTRTGLRLSIARRLVQRLGGDLSLDRDPDGRSVLTIRIADAPLLVEASAR